ncbi:hypothetical protein [Streptomyces sp. WAC 01529]|uniref:hypothetical protein n=1 Tax=Streptomyces sp. WAC 01529 TaxID=2203205 RepID=UPI000F73B129|nr:hypothetical protein [Streptomyces sp. WAC 01529]
MRGGSKPIDITVFFCETGKVYIEITWIRLRPYRMLGARVDARALEGRWVSAGEHPRIEVRETKLP